MGWVVIGCFAKEHGLFVEVGTLCPFESLDGEGDFGAAIGLDMQVCGELYGLLEGGFGGVATSE